MNEQLGKDLDYLYGTLQREGITVTDVTADEAIKAVTEQRASTVRDNVRLRELVGLLALGRMDGRLPL